MDQLKEYIVNESVEFSKMENNPLIYTLIVPRILNGADLELVKKDEQLKAAITVTEKFIKENLSKDMIKNLTNSIRPATVIDVFKLSKNYKETFATFFCEFKSAVTAVSTSFSKCIELDKKFDTLYNSPEYQIYKNTL